jgi:hypothetical protein
LDGLNTFFSSCFSGVGKPTLRTFWALLKAFLAVISNGGDDDYIQSFWSTCRHEFDMNFEKIFSLKRFLDRGCWTKILKIVENNLKTVRNKILKPFMYAGIEISVI